jgi:predicted AlkP superfamily pyrophosphatase or phosphodiesterase
MRLTAPALALLGSLIVAAVAHAAPVLMISIDGLRPADLLDAQARGTEVPNLQRMVRDGAWASGVRGALPTVTYPNHTTLVTGVWPDRHGIAANNTFDPLRRSAEGWYWYAPAIKAPTLWDAVHAKGRTTASLGWPVSVDNPAIDDNIPEYWRTRTPEDAPLVEALSTPRGFAQAAMKSAGVDLTDMVDTNPSDDLVKAKLAVAFYALKKPYFFTLHLSSLDHVEHMYGPGSPEANDALARIDAEVGTIVKAARRAEPDLVTVIVSDHGFAPVAHDVNLPSAFVEAGLITLDAAGKPIAWQAVPWVNGGSASVVLARRDDEALRARVAALLARLSADPQSGLGRMIDRKGIAALGGADDSDFFIDAKIGYLITNRLTGPLVTPGSQKGTHGYFPEHPEMRATLIVDGPGLKTHGPLGEVDMRDVAPTVAGLLGVSLPSAAGKPLF